MRPFSLLLLAILGLGACSNPAAPDDPAAELQLNRDRWSRTGVVSYRFTITRDCFCTPEMSGPVVIEVRAGEVISRTYEGGSAVDPQFADLFVTIPGLFGIVEDAILSQAAALSVRYDPELGYPRSIAIDPVAGVADDEVSYRVTGFAALAN